MTLTKTARRTALVALIAITPAMVCAKEIACASDGGFNRCPLPNAFEKNVKIEQVLSGNCKFDKTWWTDSDGIAVDKGCGAVFSYGDHGKTGSAGTDEAASRAYDHGCKFGKKDAKAHMSMAFERHEGKYPDSLADTFRAGYEKCWTQHR